MILTRRSRPVRTASATCRTKTNVRHKFPQIGTVVIEDDVEIGACTCIDRAALGETRIGRATKIDNLRADCANVEIGERVVIAAQTGISAAPLSSRTRLSAGKSGGRSRAGRSGAISARRWNLAGKNCARGRLVGNPVQRSRVQAIETRT